MDNQNNPRQRESESKGTAPMRIWFGIFMVIFYVGIGILLIIANNTFQIYKPVITIIVGVILCIYGLWRGYRLWKNKP